jgi:hypothetical protein
MRLSEQSLEEASRNFIFIILFTKTKGTDLIFKGIKNAHLVTQSL